VENLEKVPASAEYMFLKVDLRDKAAQLQVV